MLQGRAGRGWYQWQGLAWYAGEDGGLTDDACCLCMGV